MFIIFCQSRIIVLPGFSEAQLFLLVTQSIFPLCPPFLPPCTHAFITSFDSMNISAFVPEIISEHSPESAHHYQIAMKPEYLMLICSMLIPRNLNTVNQIKTAYW